MSQAEADALKNRAERRKRTPRPTVREQRLVGTAMAIYAGSPAPSRPWITVYRWLADKDGTNPAPRQCRLLAEGDARTARRSKRNAAKAARKRNRNG